jgi:hypothetical protein
MLLPLVDGQQRRLHVGRAPGPPRPAAARPFDLCGSHEDAKDLVQETYVGVRRHGRPCVLAGQVAASAVVALAAAPLLPNGHR